MTSALRLYRAVVVGGDDPEGLGRVRLRIAFGPDHEAGVETAVVWFRVSTTAGHEIALRSDGSLALAAGQVTVDAGMAKFSGVVQCDTLIANNVVAATYTPGAGNLV